MKALLLRSAEFAATPALPRFAEVLAELLGAEGVEALCWRTDPRFATPLAGSPFAKVTHYVRAASSRSMTGWIGLPLWLLRITRQLVAGRYEVVQASDVFSLLPCVVLRPLLHFVVIGDVRDHMASIAGTHWGARAKVLGLLENALLRRCDAVIVVDETRKELLTEDVRRHAKIIVVRNLPQRDAGRAQETERNEVLVNFSGYISRMRGGEMLGDAVASAPFAALDVVGETNDVELAAFLARTPRVTLHGRVSHAEAMDRMKGSDLVSLLYDPAIAANRYAAPNKFYEAMMVGRPVLVSEGTPMADWVRQHDCGYVVAYGDKQGVAEVLARISGNRADWALRCRNARAYFEREMRWADEADVLKTAYRGLGIGEVQSAATGAGER